MTEQKAVEILNEVKVLDDSMYQYSKDYMGALDMAISALEEVQQYHEIGTVSECREAREKQISKKPYYISEVDENDNADVECPVCHYNTDYEVYEIKTGYCWKCGQKLDWSDTE